jgi:hypothetical protein
VINEIVSLIRFSMMCLLLKIVAWDKLSIATATAQCAEGRLP